MNDRTFGGVSRGELERRWALVRAHMQERGLDVIIAQATDTTNNAGYTRWLTDSVTAYRHVVMFFRDDPMSVVEHGPHGTRRELADRDPSRPGVGTLSSVAQFPAIHYTQSYEAAIVVEELRRRGARHVGLVGTSLMPNGFLSTMRDGLAASVEISDETEVFDLWKSIKSEEERAHIRRAIEMHDRIFLTLLERLQPGMRDCDVAALIHSEGRKFGSTHGTIMTGSAPAGEPAPILPPHLQGRVIGAGDCLHVLLENAGPGGWFGELARPIVFGKASNQLQEMSARVREAQDHTRRLLVPGASCRDIFAAHNDWMRSHGMAVETRIHAHGQGYDIVERPLIRFDESMEIRANMFFAVHPIDHKPGAHLFLCDNCFVPEGGEPVFEHRTERRIFEI